MLQVPVHTLESEEYKTFFFSFRIINWYQLSQSLKMDRSNTNEDVKAEAEKEEDLTSQRLFLFNREKKRNARPAKVILAQDNKLWE